MEKKIHKSSIVDKIIYAIIDMIDQRVLSPGDKLDSEREFAQKLNVSRTSVREALKSLSFVQLVEIRPSDGTYLTDDINLINEFCTKYNPLVVLNGIDYQKAYESRKIFESTVTELAANRATEEDILLLRESIDIQQQLLHQEDTWKYQIEDLRFHRLIAVSTHNEILSEQAAICLKHLEKHKLSVANALITFDEHQQILSAIEAKDPYAARLASDHHLDTIRGNLDIKTQLNK